MSWYNEQESHNYAMNYDVIGPQEPIEYAPFIRPTIQYNENGWGPIETLDMDMPYQPFSKSDRVGKICDWTKTNASEKKYQNKYMSSFGVGNQYSYYHEDDDSTFQLVDSGRIHRPPYQRSRFRPNVRNIRMMRNRNFRPGHNPVGTPQVQQNKGNKQREVRRTFGKMFNPTRNVQQRVRESSVVVRADWVSIEEMDFPRLMKLALPNIKEGEDLATTGALEYYDKLFDRINVKNERSLAKIDRVINIPTTTDDPIIRRLSKTVGNVFATDDLLATIMCTTRSKYSWDIIVEKLGDKIFLDKRNSKQFSLLTVNETSLEPPLDEEGSINSPHSLSMEATFINHNFSQQVLKMGELEQKYKFEEENPFQEPGVQFASVGYRYKKWELGNEVVLVARCRQDGILQSPNGDLQFLSIRALNEWDSKLANCVEWRQKLDTQRGAVLASELRNNACKLAKWTVEAVLASSDQLKLGYVSRINPRDHLRHVILGTQQFNPQEFATQINLSMDNSWGILRCIIDLVMKQSDGKYLLVKDPNKPMIRLYDVPDNSFETESDEDDFGEVGDYTFSTLGGLGGESKA